MGVTVTGGVSEGNRPLPLTKAPCGPMPAPSSSERAMTATDAEAFKRRYGLHHERASA
ncbi:MAG: hypothetical protein M1826_000476 [Phylliscum demangeonii]|nr:MAG: hypothetical protein M1826_000476 [Phylliscum demangeonii]